MRFLSNFGCKIIFTCSVSFWHQHDFNSLYRKHWSRDQLVQVAVLVCHFITLKMNALSLKQLHQAPIFGEDTDVIYLHSCDLNTKFNFTVPSLQIVRLNVVFGQFIFVSSLVESR